MALSTRIHWRLPNAFVFPLAMAYEETIVELGNSLESGVMLDIGAGLSTASNGDLGLNPELKLIGIDILEAALQQNRDLDYRIVADACQQWPVADASVDLIVSRSVIEHLPDPQTFAAECHRVLKPGGYCVHLMPARNAPFAILNRLLPRAVSRRLLDWVFPEKKELLGFPAFYRSCTFAEINALFADSGFSVDQIYCRYYQSTYYASFFPAYLISVAYDLIVWRFGIRRLCSQLLVVASAQSH